MLSREKNYVNYLSIKIISNQKSLNYKVVDLNRKYKFHMQFIIHPRSRKLQERYFLIGVCLYIYINKSEVRPFSVRSPWRGLRLTETFLSEQTSHQQLQPISAFSQNKTAPVVSQTNRLLVRVIKRSLEFELSLHVLISERMDQKRTMAWHAHSDTHG
jgi:hypothetical protein